MIGVVIPVHNEEAYLRSCLASVQMASLHPALREEEVRVMVVLDACSDGSEQIVRALQLNSLPTLSTLSIDARNVGQARAAGAAHLLRAGARWLAFTDADSVVSHAWLAMQLSLGADAVCGTVTVDDWDRHGQTAATLRQRFFASYRDHDQHRHIHGANLGVSAQAYMLSGGFSALTCGEDVALVQALIANGAHISWSAAPRVCTSSRFASHARGGFGDTLRALALATPPTLPAIP